MDRTNISSMATAKQKQKPSAPGRTKIISALTALIERPGTPAQVVEYFEETVEGFGGSGFKSIRWRDGEFCPYCGHDKVYALKANRYHARSAAIRSRFWLGRSLKIRSFRYAFGSARFGF